MRTKNLRTKGVPRKRVMPITFSFDYREDGEIKVAAQRVGRSLRRWVVLSDYETTELACKAAEAKLLESEAKDA